MKRKLVMLLSAALLLILVMALPALASAKTWENCTVDITEIMVGDIITGHVTVTDNTNVSSNVHWDNDCNLTLVTKAMDPNWCEFWQLNGNEFLEKINSWGNDYTQFQVVSNTAAAPGIKFDMQGHGMSIAKQDVDIGGHGEKPDNPSETGYIFCGWYKEASCSNTYDFETETVNGVVTVYARWSPIGYTVAFDANGGSGSMADESFIYDDEWALTPNAFTWTGHTFLGWNTDKGTSDVEYADGEKVLNLTSENNAVVTLYAVWIENSYTVTFDANGGSGTMADKSFWWGEWQELTANAFTRTGYTFLGWNTDKAATAAGYADGEEVLNLTSVNNAVVTLYAVWAGNGYKVAFDANGGSGAMAEESFVYGEEQALTASAFTRNGYTFLGWNTDKGASDAEYADGEKVLNLTDEKGGAVTLYAVWSENGYTVKFDMNGHGTAVASQTVEKGGKVARPADPAENGYIFKGWHKKDNGGRLTPYDFDTEVTADLTLYAFWRSIYTVKFEMNGHGTAVASQTVESGGKVAKPEDPAENGYTFMG